MHNPCDGQTTTSARYFLGFASFASQRRIFLGEKEGKDPLLFTLLRLFRGRLVAILVLSLAFCFRTNKKRQKRQERSWMGICLCFFRQVRTKRKSKKVMGGKARFCFRKKKGEGAMGDGRGCCFFLLLLSDSGANMGGWMGIISVDCALDRYSLHTHNPPLLPCYYSVFWFAICFFCFFC